MRIIKELAEWIHEEIGDAEKYITKANVLASDHPSLAKTLYDLSHNELDHAMRLHDHVKRAVSDARDKHGEPPAYMVEMWNEEHEEIIRRTGEVKAMQSMFKI